MEEEEEEEEREEEGEGGTDYRPGILLTALILVVAVGLALAIAGVLVSTGKGVQPITGVTVILPTGVGTDQSLNYQPPSITIVVGVNNTITWSDVDSVPHTVTSSQGAPVSFDSKTMTQGNAYTFTFTTPGTYEYFCRFHTWMKGTVVVKAA